MNSWSPTAAQEPFLASGAFEAAFGGATGGGNTEVLVVDPLRFVHHADFRGIIFVATTDELRRTLVERTTKFYGAMGATLRDRIWHFPSGARIELAVMRRPADRFRFDAEWHYVAFDDLAAFTEEAYLFMISRLRSSNAAITPRVRSSVQPAGPGREWVLDRFRSWLTGELPSGARLKASIAEKESLSRRMFWGSVDDNPHADDGYTDRLAMAYDHVTFEQRRNGNWEITQEVGAPTPLTARPEDMGLLEFVTALSPRFTAPYHLSDVVDFFEAIDRGEEVRGLVSVPRRHGKTELLLHGIAWLLARHPEWTIGYAGYNKDFTVGKSRRCRDLAVAAGVELRADSNSTREWRTTAGGGLLSDGIGGGWTGHGVQLLVVDDPHKSRSEADSPVKRGNVWDWWISAGISSVEPDAELTQRGAALVVHTRWHAGDLIGLLVKQSEQETDEDYGVMWKYVNLPAINGDGEALWPERWPLDALQRRKREVGPFEWASLYQGQPRRRGGKVFNAPTFYRELPVLRIKRAYGADLAYTVSTKADYSSLTEMLRHDRPRGGPKDPKPLPDFYIPFAVSEQVEAPDFAATMKARQMLKPGKMLFLGSGIEKGSAQFIKKIVPNFHIENASTDKFTRSLELQAAWNDGRVMVPDPDVYPEAKKWLAPFLDVFDAFTGDNDTRDDEVDATAAAHKVLDNTTGVSDLIRGYS